MKETMKESLTRNLNGARSLMWTPNLGPNLPTLIVGIGLAVVSGLGATSPVQAEDGNSFGTVIGVIRFSDDYPKAEVIKVDRDPGTCGTRYKSEEYVVDPVTKGLQFAVAKLKDVASPEGVSGDASVLIDQSGCTYLPHVQVAYLSPKDQAAGTAIEVVIRNSDDVFHTVHAYSSDEKTVFNTPSIAATDVSKELNSPGVYHVQCDIHTWMSAYILVVDNPYASVTDSEGTFRIENVPPGTYTLNMWHEGLGSIDREVVVTAGEESRVDFVLGDEG